MRLKMRVGKNTPWLVKSAGRVQGPFLDKEISALLRTREVVILDEVSRPCGRWTYIRDEPSFASIVEEVRQKNMRMRDDADDTTHAEHTDAPTRTVSLTDPLDPKADDLTEEIPFHERAKVQEVFYQSIDDNGPSHSSSEAYVYEGDKIVQQQANKTAKSLWIVTIVLVCVTLAYVAMNRLVVSPAKNIILNQESKELAISFAEQGNYEQSLVYFRRAHELSPEDLSVYLQLAIIGIQLEGQTLIGKRLLERLLSEQSRGHERVLTGLGLADLVDNNLNAAETRFNKALDVDPIYTPAVINLGALALKREDYARANNYLQLSIKDGSQDGIEHLMVVESLIKIYETEKDLSLLRDAQKFVANYLKENRAYFREVLVADIYIHHLLNEHNRIYGKIDLFLDVDPKETDLHRKNLFVYRNVMGWNRLSEWCLKSTQSLDPNARVITFEGLCLIDNNQVMEATRKLSDAVTQAPRDPLVQAAFGYVQQKAGVNEASRVAVERSIDFDRNKAYEVPRVMQSRLCVERGDHSCAFLYLTELYEINSRSLPAISGLARIYLEQGRFVEVEEFLKRGKTVSSQYRPLLEIEKLFIKEREQARAKGL
jgi:tetratricopeptide (TPR) repeat protein